MNFLDFQLLGPPKWREPHKSLKFVDFVESGPFRQPFPRPLWISWISGLWDRRNEGNPTKVQKLSILQSPLLFRKPFPRPLWISWISGLWDRRIKETPQKPKICGFCRVRSFSGSHFQGPCGFPGFPASATADMEGTPQKLKICRFCRVRSFSGSHFQNPASISRIQPLRGRPGRSLCVAPLKEELWESMWPFSGGHILEKGPPRDRPRMCSKPFIL